MLNPTERPSCPCPLLENIPQALRERNQWVNWRFSWDAQRGKWTKTPINARTGKSASSTDAATWCNIGTALDRLESPTGGVDGIGFVFTPQDDLVGIDLDHCLTAEGEWAPWAASIVEELDSFTEVSPSGQGLHVFVLGRIEDELGSRRGPFECYSQGRFFTVTGHMPTGLDHSLDVEERQQALNNVRARMLSRQAPEATSPQKDAQAATGAALPPWKDDLALLEKSFGWKGKAPMNVLWAGQFKAAKYNSQSEADQAFCNHLAFLFQKDAVRMDRAFRESGLMRPKWDTIHVQGATYGEATLAKAIRDTRNVFTPRPVVRIEVGRIDLAADGLEEALVQGMPKAKEPHQVFQRGGNLVRIAREVDTGSDGRRIFGVAKLAPVLPVNLLDTASRAVAFEKWNERKNTYVPCNASDKVLQVVCARGMWDHFPPLKALIQAPLMTLDGRIIDRPGYDERTGLFSTSNLRVQVKDAPALEDAKAALTPLWELIQHFPFVGREDKSAALALLLTAMARPALPFTPLFMVTAPTRGSGKSELVDVALALATGKRCPVLGYAADPEEFRKALAAKLMTCPAALSIDNVNGVLKSDELCQAVTQEAVECRILGKSEHALIPNTSLICATGNNITVSEDLTRRVLPIRLDPGCEHPEERTFPFNPVDRVKEHRAAYVSAALTLLKAYHAAGSPHQQLTPWAGFDAWGRMVRNALVWAGCPDPCIGRAAVVADDPVAALLGRFLAAWHAEFASTGRTIKEAVARTKDEDVHGLGEVLQEISGERGQVNNNKAANWMKRHIGRVVQGLKLVKGDTYGCAQQWHVVKA